MLRTVWNILNRARRSQYTVRSELSERWTGLDIMGSDLNSVQCRLCLVWGHLNAAHNDLIACKTKKVQHEATKGAKYCPP